MHCRIKPNDIYLDDNGSESDVQEQQPTEATDDSKYNLMSTLINYVFISGNDPCQIQTATESIINGLFFFRF